MLSATYGVVRWVRLQSNEKISRCPTYLIDLAIETLPFNLANTPESPWDALNDDDFLAVLNVEQQEQLEVTLDRIRCASIIAPGSKVDSFPNGLIPWDQRPPLRARASRIAAKLFSLCQLANGTPTQKLIDWEKDARGDSLPEVREPWKKISPTLQPSNPSASEATLSPSIEEG